MIALAREQDIESRIDYRVVDATKEADVLQLGKESFDGALCNMALMDMAEIDPFMRAEALLLRPGGRFVVSILHPCFNNPAAVHTGELEDQKGSIVTTYSVKVPRNITTFKQFGLAMHGQSEPHPYLHRPISALLTHAFRACLVLDRIEEPSFAPDYAGGTTPLSLNGRFSEIPPILVLRQRRPWRIATAAVAAVDTVVAQAIRPAEPARPSTRRRPARKSEPDCQTE